MVKGLFGSPVFSSVSSQDDAILKPSSFGGNISYRFTNPDPHIACHTFRPVTCDWSKTSHTLSQSRKGLNSNSAWQPVMIILRWSSRLSSICFTYILRTHEILQSLITPVHLAASRKFKYSFVAIFVGQYAIRVL
jgi:hypothetical protein